MPRVLWLGKGTVRQTGCTFRWMMELTWVMPRSLRLMSL